MNLRKLAHEQCRRSFILLCIKSNYQLQHNAHTHSPPTCYGVGSVFRFHRIRRCRVSTGLNSTKPAPTCASIPEKHDGSSCNPISTSIPTLCTHITIQNSTKKTTKKKVKKIENTHYNPKLNKKNNEEKSEKIENTHYNPKLNKKQRRKK